MPISIDSGVNSDEEVPWIFARQMAWSLVAITADAMGDLTDEGARDHSMRMWNFDRQWLEVWLWWSGWSWSSVGGRGNEC